MDCTINIKIKYVPNYKLSKKFYHPMNTLKLCHPESRSQYIHALSG